MTDGEKLLRTWATDIEREYPKKIEMAKKEVNRSKVKALLWYALAIFLCFSDGTESMRAYLGIVPFLLGTMQLMGATSGYVKGFEKQYVMVARLNSRGDFASVIDREGESNGRAKYFRKLEELEKAGIALGVRVNAERAKRASEGLRY